MKRSADFILRQVAGKTVLVPVGAAAVAFPGMVDLNSCGSYIWQLLEKEHSEEALVAALTERYEVDESTARADARQFTDRLRSVKAIVD